MNDTIRYVGKDVGEAAWSTEKVATGATEMDDGRVNTTIIKKISGWKDLYPAFALCDALNTGGVTGWYLLAYYELCRIVSNEIYWSSSEYEYSEGMARTNYKACDKKDIFIVKAIHRF